MRRDLVDVEVAALAGGVPLFEVAISGIQPSIWLYQRDDAAWLPIFPADRAAIARPERRGAIDVPLLVAELFPELVR